MSQINYNIFQELEKQDNHIRGLAKALRTNQTTIARKATELEKQNILQQEEKRIEEKEKKIEAFELTENKEEQN